MIDREYGVPDFPSFSDGFDSPKIQPFISTELENTDTFSVHDIFDLGFLRSNPNKKIYFHNTIPDLFLEELYERDFRVKDLIVRRVVVYYEPVDSQSLTIKKIIYNTTSPDKEELKKLL